MSGPTVRALACATLALAAPACAPPPAGAPAPPSAPPYRWSLPPGFPVPRVPADNPMSDAKVELGRRLFYEPLLSADGNYACAWLSDVRSGPRRRRWRRRRLGSLLGLEPEGIAPRLKLPGL